MLGDRKITATFTGEKLERSVARSCPCVCVCVCVFVCVCVCARVHALLPLL
jgi:hypothetical protein